MPQCRAAGARYYHAWSWARRAPFRSAPDSTKVVLMASFMEIALPKPENFQFCANTYLDPLRRGHRDWLQVNTWILAYVGKQNSATGSAQIDSLGIMEPCRSNSWGATRAPQAPRWTGCKARFGPSCGCSTVEEEEVAGRREHAPGPAHDTRTHGHTAAYHHPHSTQIQVASHRRPDTGAVDGPRTGLIPGLSARGAMYRRSGKMTAPRWFHTKRT